MIDNECHVSRFALEGNGSQKISRWNIANTSSTSPLSPSSPDIILFSLLLTALKYR